MSAHSIKPGAFFVSSWGYDQTNVGSVRTPARSTRRDGIVTWLDPSRVPAELLRELNPELLALLGMSELLALLGVA